MYTGTEQVNSHQIVGARFLRVGVGVDRQAMEGRQIDVCSNNEAGDISINPCFS